MDGCKSDDKESKKLFNKVETKGEQRETINCKNERIKFNVGGKTFECFTGTLKRFPGSKLSELDGDSDAFDAENGEYFFDRNPVMFEAILEACRTGELHMPRETCHSTLNRELEFWRISPNYLSPCCWKSFYRANNDKKTISDLVEFYRLNTNMSRMMNGQNSFRAKLWLFLDEPRSSKYAMMWTVFMSVFVIISTFCLTWETVGTLRVDSRSKQQKETIDYFIQLYGFVNTTDMDIINYYYRMHPVFYIPLIICFIFLSFDIALRLLSCPNLCDYLKYPTHICEILGVCAFWLNGYADIYLEQFRSQEAYVFLLIIRCLIALQTLRLVRIGKNLMAFNIMSLSVSSSLPEIAVLFSLLLIWISVFGWLMYMAEFFNDKFDSGFAAMYWALITLTTVGYGDLYPETVFGHMVAAACAICGLVTLALPIGVIAASFNNYYSHHKYVAKHIKKYKPHGLEIWQNSKMRQ